MPYALQRSLRIDNKGHLAPFWLKHQKSRSQDLEELYQDAAQFNWIDIAQFLDCYGKQNDIYPKAIPIKVPRIGAQDIDTQEDWELAELLHKATKGKQKID